MLTQEQIAAYLITELPEIETEFKNVSASSILETFKCLVKYTQGKVMLHDLKTVKKCFAIADDIYCQGNTLVKNAIENIFVKSFSSIINSRTREEIRELHALVPLSLYTAYMQQVLKADKIN